MLKNKNKSESQFNATKCNEIESPVVSVNNLSGDTVNTSRNPIDSKQVQLFN